MFKPVISKPIIRMAAAGLVAGAIALAITAAPAANGRGATQGQNVKQVELLGRSDRLRVPVKGAECSQHAWPDFEQKCQFDFRVAGGQARAVRVIALR